MHRRRDRRLDPPGLAATPAPPSDRLPAGSRADALVPRSPGSWWFPSGPSKNTSGTSSANSAWPRRTPTIAGCWPSSATCSPDRRHRRYQSQKPARRTSGATYCLGGRLGPLRRLPCCTSPPAIAPSLPSARKAQRADLERRLARSEGLEPQPHRSVDTCQPFSVLRIGPPPGMIASRLSAPVRLASEVVRADGSHVGSQPPHFFMSSPITRAPGGTASAACGGPLPVPRGPGVPGAP